jgi:hypothetical protein
VSGLGGEGERLEDGFDGGVLEEWGEEVERRDVGVVSASGEESSDEGNIEDREEVVEEGEVEGAEGDEREGSEDGKKKLRKISMSVFEGDINARGEGLTGSFGALQLPSEPWLEDRRW